MSKHACMIMHVCMRLSTLTPYTPHFCLPVFTVCQSNMFFFARTPPHLLPVSLHVCPYVRTFARTFGRTFGRTHARSVARSVVRTHVRSYVRSYVRTFGRTFARTFARAPPFRTFVRTYNPPSFNTSKNALKSSLATF